jgi:alkylated DNA repair dioxygenase AlkB
MTPKMEGGKRRTLDTFFQRPPPKKARLSESKEPPSTHSTYPFPVARFPMEISDALGFCPAAEARVRNDQPDLDLLYFQPYISKEIADDLFRFLRRELFFYRVHYNIKRGNVETPIRTPRFTTVFGVDDTARFLDDGRLADAKTSKELPQNYYKCKPRPIPACLDSLRKVVEGTTGKNFNFCLVNYYASGDDSISFHSDDERFLGTNPSIASLSLGATRDFLMKHKPAKDGKLVPDKTLKFALSSGDMVLMKGTTQAEWLHSIPKRKSGDASKGRINITFRKALVQGGTENYYRYNVGQGPVHSWDEATGKMVVTPSLLKYSVQ